MNSRMRGFTLIELLVVCAIIVILIPPVYGLYDEITGRARLHNTRLDLDQQLHQVALLYEQDARQCADWDFRKDQNGTLIALRGIPGRDGAEEALYQYDGRRNSFSRASKVSGNNAFRISHHFQNVATWKDRIVSSSVGSPRAIGWEVTVRKRVLNGLVTGETSALVARRPAP